MMLLIFVILVNYLYFTNSQESDCLTRVYRECRVPSFTDDEFNTAVDYILTVFGETNPSQPACRRDQFYVRKEIRCLTDREYQDLVEVWLRLYADGTVDEFTINHVNNWAAEHKFSEGTRAHYEFVNQFERRMRAINPNVSMPYWFFPQDFAHPELSRLWDLFGHSGSESNDYCIPDGPFAGVLVNASHPHCIRRQWRPDRTMWPWKSPEYLTATHQMLLDWPLVSTFVTQFLAQTFPSITSLEQLMSHSPDILYSLNPRQTPYAQLQILYAWIAHFDTHLSMGGWAGDMSVQIAPNDPVFYMLHETGEIHELSWQASGLDSATLVPRSYNMGISYNTSTGQRWLSSLDTDRLNMFPEVYVKDTFRFGYGQRCYMYDVAVKRIAEVANRIKQGLKPVDPNKPLPMSARRLKRALSASDFERFYPKFASNNWTDFDHVFLDVGLEDCNRPPRRACAVMPRAPHYADTANGRRQFAAFGAVEGHWDIQPIVRVGESIYDQFMDALSGYCSPNSVLP